MTQLYPDSLINSPYPVLESVWDDNEGYGIINADPEELFQGGLCTIPRSICDDIRLIESGGSDYPGSENSEVDDTIPSPKIRNYNCMWSGKSSPVSLSCTLSPMGNAISAVPLAEIIGDTNSKINQTIIKTEQNDETDNQQQIKQQQRMVQRQMQQQQQFTSQQSMQKIPPGTSLLLNSRKTNQQQQQQMQQQQQIHKKIKGNSIQIPVIQTSEFLRDRDLIASSGAAPTFGRPDTPHSLDDDATEFKHTYDLTACVTGSNNISLLDGSEQEKMIAINKLREQLEDSNKKIVSCPNGMTVGSLADVLSIIDKESSSHCIKQELDEFGDTCCNWRYGSTDHSSQQQNSTGDWDSSDDASSFDEDVTSSVSKRSGCSSSLSFSSNPLEGVTAYPVKHSDHSYTRSKDGIDDISPNLETPSDSDEEIDVVSLGDKKLPTNPSDKDRRALQNKVAHKFSARIVKTANGIRTIPPRRRVSYDLPYTPASVSPVKSGSSLANSRYPSPSNTPYSSSQYSSSSSSSSSSKYHHHSNSRKRIANNCSIRTGGNGVIINGSNSDEFMPPSKRHRGKKQKTTANVSIKQRHYSVDEVDTIEKRNLHNDMERQRRIGLKNLFEALKKQIPSIKDKERAPKVNILREAAKLCENLTREEQHLRDHVEMLKEQLRKRQEILNKHPLKQNAAARGC